MNDKVQEWKMKQPCYMWGDIFPSSTFQPKEEKEGEGEEEVEIRSQDVQLFNANFDALIMFKILSHKNSCYNLGDIANECFVSLFHLR